MKKFWDITPPKNNKEIKESRKEKSKKKFSFKFNWGIFLFLVALGLGLFVTFEMSKSEIKIWPKTQTFNLDSNFTVDTGVLENDYEENIVSGRVFEEEVEITDEFPVTGTTKRKAEGVIRLYNAYTTRTETWLAGTRFVSEGGKIFKSKEKIVVPGAEIQNDKIIPSHVDVPVVAVESGEEYNIEPSSFSIYVYRGTDRYTNFYGESFQPMEGGGELGKITSNDLESAEDVLVAKVKQEATKLLRSKIEDEYVILDDAFKEVILERFSSNEEEEIVNNFDFTVKGKSKVISFESEIARDLVRNYVESQIPKNSLLYEDSLKIDYNLENVDWENETLSVNFTVETETYPQIDIDFLKDQLKGKQASETEFLLENQNEITDAEINFWPFWVNTVPKEKERIEVIYPLIS